MGSGESRRESRKFDYSKARPNRFASRYKEETVAVVLDADVADVFQSSEAVDTVLRSAIRAMRTAGVKSAKATKNESGGGGTPPAQPAGRRRS